MLAINLLACVLIFCVTVHVHSSSIEDENRFDALLHKLEELETNDALGQMELDAMKTKLVAMETAHAQKIGRMDLELQRLKSLSDVDKTTGQRRASSQSQIAFYAIVSPHYVQHINAGDRVIFDHEYTNIGQGYNVNSGMFVAPVAGTYVISVTVSGRKDHGATSYYTVNVNNDIRAKLLSQTGQQDTNRLVLRLVPGDSVSVTTREGNNALLGTHYTSFSGFLLYEDPSSGPIVGK